MSFETPMCYIAKYVVVPGQKASFCGVELV